MLTLYIHLFYLIAALFVIERFAEIVNLDLYNYKLLFLPLIEWISFALITLIIISICVHIIRFPFTNDEYFEDVKKTNHESNNKNKTPILKRIKSFLKNAINIGPLAVISILISGMLLFVMFKFIDVADPNAKKTHEVLRLVDEATQKEIDYFVVGYYKDNAILLEIHIDDNHHAYFEKNHYTIMPLEGEKISYTTFSNVDHK